MYKRQILVRTAGSCLAGVSFRGVARAARQGEYSVYFTASPGPAVAAIIAFIEASGDRLIEMCIRDRDKLHLFDPAGGAAYR